MNASLLCAYFAMSTWAGQTPPPLPAEPPILPPPSVLTSPAPASAFTLRDFAKSFTPAPGDYEVILLHPTKCYPVKVCFTLPPGCPKVHVTKRQLEFDYGKREVRIRFPILGDGARVSYH